MDFKTSVSNEVDENEWNQLLSKNHASTAYQISNWPKIYEYTYDSKPFYVTVETSNGRVIGQLASVLHNKLFWQGTNPFLSFIGTKLNLRSVLNWFYGPIIHEPEYHDEITHEILKAIDNIAKKEKITMVRGISPPLDEKTSNKQFESYGYKIEPWSTYITDLKQNTNELYNSLNKKTRYDIRKSESNDLKFVIADTRNDYTDFSEIKVESKKRLGQKAKPTPEFYDAHWELMYKQGYEKLFLVRHDDEAIGGIFGMIFKGKFIQHGVGNSDKTYLLGGTFLTWNTIKWSISENLSHFDVGGANPNPELDKEKQIDFYKSKWGGKKYQYYLYTKIFNKTKTKISALVKNPKNLRKK